MKKRQPKIRTHPTCGVWVNEQLFEKIMKKKLY